MKNTSKPRPAFKRRAAKTAVILLITIGAFLLLLVTGIFALIGGILEIIEIFKKHWTEVIKDAYRECVEIVQAP